MKRKTVSLCMIARNEEATIGRTIKSALALVDEIVVVDTGSADNTRIIAEGYGARIIDHAWQEDFSAARNAALETATGEWILLLDCDEHLQSVRPLIFQRLLSVPSVAGYRVRIVGHQADERLATDNSLRLFRNHPEVRFRYPVYEQISPCLLRHAAEADLVVIDAPLTVVHDPGGPEKISRKRERNLRLLRQAVEDMPDEPYFSTMLGGEMLFWHDDEVLPVAGLRAGLKHLEHAWSLIAARLPEARSQIAFGPMLVVDLAAALLAVGRPREAAAVVEAAKDQWMDHAHLHVQGIRSRLACLVHQDDPAQREKLATDIRRELQVLDNLLAAKSLDSDKDRPLPGLIHCYRGELALAEGNIAAGAEAFEQALTVNEDLSGAWVGLAECSRLAGDRKRALRLYLRAVTASEWNDKAWERGISLMEELGFHDNAQSWRAKVQERFPERATRTARRDAPAIDHPVSPSDVIGIA